MNPLIVIQKNFINKYGYIFHFSAVIESDIKPTTFNPTSSDSCIYFGMVTRMRQQSVIILAIYMPPNILLFLYIILDSYGVVAIKSGQKSQNPDGSYE
jgi:hypothetical protein